MVEDDADLEMRLAAEDEMSGVVNQASENWLAAMREMEDSSKTATTAVEKLGDTSTDAASKVEVAGQKVRESWSGASDAMRESRGHGEGLMGILVELGHAGHSSMFALQSGAAIAKGSVEGLTRGTVALGSKFLTAVASGNLLAAALTAGAAVFGIFSGKAKEAEAAAVKAAEESLKATEKTATEIKRIEEESAKDRDATSKTLAESKLHTEDELLSALENKRDQDLAKTRLDSEARLKILGERLVKEQAILEVAQKEKTGSKSEKETKIADEAIAAAQKAISQTQSAQAQERELVAAQASRIQHDYIKADEQEALKLREASVAVLSRQAEARRKDVQAFNELLRAKTQALNLDKEMASAASEESKISELRRQGRDAEADQLRQLLTLTQAKAAAEKQIDWIKARLEGAAKLNAAGELQKRQLESHLGLFDDQKAELDKIYAAYESISQKIREGMDFELASKIYAEQKAEILAQEEKRLAQINLQYDRQSQTLRLALDTELQRSQQSAVIHAAQQAGEAKIAMAASDRLKAMEDSNAKLSLYLHYQQMIDDAVRTGDTAHIDALREQYEMEKQLLAIKQQETAEEKLQRELGAAGVSVTGSGITGTHADKGLRKRWQQRNILGRELKLQKQAEFGGDDYMGFTLGPGDDFNSAGPGGWGIKGDMGVSGGTRRGAPEIPELETPPGFGKPGLPTLPSLGGGTTGEASTEPLKAQLDAAVAKLEEIGRQMAANVEAAKGVGKTLEPIPGLQKNIAESTKIADDHVKELKVKIDDTFKAMNALGTQIENTTRGTGEGLMALNSKIAAVEAEWRAFQKQLADLTKK